MDKKNRKAYKKMTKDELIDNIDQLNKNCESWAKRYREYREIYDYNEEAATTPKRPWYGWKFGSVSFDFWPPREWLRLDYRPWGPGKYAQLCIGPIRIDWADS